MAFFVVFILTFKAVPQCLIYKSWLFKTLVELVIEGIIHEGAFLANHCDPSNLVINR